MAKVIKSKEIKSNSDVFEIYLGTFINNAFTWYSIKKMKDPTTAYKEFKKYVNTQLKYTDEELQKVWDTGRLDIELRQGNKLLNWVGIYSREVKPLSKKEEKEAEKGVVKKNKDKKEKKDAESVEVATLRWLDEHGYSYGSFVKNGDEFSIAVKDIGRDAEDELDNYLFQKFGATLKNIECIVDGVLRLIYKLPADEDVKEINDDSIAEQIVEKSDDVKVERLKNYLCVLAAAYFERSSMTFEEVEEIYDKGEDREFCEMIDDIIQKRG